MGIFGKIFKKKKNIINSYNIATTKHSFGVGCTLKFSAETEEKKKEINDYLKNLISKYINTPEKLLRYMELKGLKVYKIRKASNFLAKISEEEGFLTPLKGFKAFIINLIIGFVYENKLKISFTTKEMFIFNTGEIEIYTIARALHKYYGFKNNLPGFDYKSQELFKKLYANSKNSITNPISSIGSLKDMFSCKEALARDLESINFTIQLSIEHERAKKALNILQSTKSTKI